MTNIKCLHDTKVALCRCILLRCTLLPECNCFRPVFRHPVAAVKEHASVRVLSFGVAWQGRGREENEWEGKEKYKKGACKYTTVV